MDQRYVKLDSIKLFVLDEADRMLDMGFIHDVRKVIAKLPTKRQTLFFSATMPAEIQSLANNILTSPAKVEVTPVSSTADTIQQSVFFVEKADKRKLLLHILKSEPMPSVLVFTRTKHGADRVARDLAKSGVHALAIHGDKSQNARQTALSNFKAGKTRVLVATDIAARGIDVDSLSHVINFELPNVPETYVHRIGRTGRAGAKGVAFSFCDTEEKEYLHDIQKLIGKQVPVQQDHPYAADGTMPFYHKPANQQQRGQGQQQHRGQGKQQHRGQGSNKPQGQKVQNASATPNANRNNSGGKRRWFGSRNENRKGPAPTSDLSY
jgi:ATP-dependent RNA helicase RhlE